MRRALLLLALAIAASGCSLDPEDPLFLYGTLPDAVGDPSKGTVELWRSKTVAAGWGPVPDPESTPAPEQEFELFATLHAEPDGFWSADLTYFDTVLLYQGHMQDRSWKAVYAPRSDLPPVEASFTFNGADVDLPPLRQWDPAVELTESADSLHLRIAPAPRIEIHDNIVVRQSQRQDRFGFQFYGPEDENVWFVPATNASAEVELPLVALEDFAVSAGPLALSTGPWISPDAGAASFTTSYSTLTQTFPKVPFAPAGAPRISLLRGQPCVETGLYGEAGDPLDPCPATDGVIKSASFEGGFSAYASQFEFPLPQSAALSWVVVRELGLTLAKNARVELRGAADGVWRPIGDVAGVVLEPLPAGSFGGGASPWQVWTSQVLAVPAGLPESDAVRISLGEPVTQEELSASGYPEGSLNIPSTIGPMTELSVF